MNETMKNLVVRTLSGLVLAAVVLGAIVWSQWSFGALLAALLVGGMYAVSYTHLTLPTNSRV